MTQHLQQFLHVQCQQFDLLVPVSQIHEVVGSAAAGTQADQHTLRWRDETLPVMNLTAQLTGQADQQVGDYLILSGAEGNHNVAVGVSQVVNIESLAEDAFSEIPQLDFPFNDYFDKAYVHPQRQQCIYRLKDMTLLAEVGEPT
ncbi:Uncharacterised protein [BD1-7 clade bacterium]|uniref:CheW-like domain-containing protein n=1 Tax=BD1-7 clade bacterium TaxID=2029982 RepID=A0A5S9MVR2_9GAMM|nr:Uncharacterised protein [BD1-7 clade bacterium]CAA0083461.1 Uncharacterised protein [BD1-7 clade bacterium]